MIRFETFERLTLRGRRFYFRIVANNHEPVAQSEAYNRKESRDHAVKIISHWAGSAAVVPERRR